MRVRVFLLLFANVSIFRLQFNRSSRSWEATKLAKLGEYKFAIAMENSMDKGYITEKVCEWCAFDMRFSIVVSFLVFVC